MNSGFADTSCDVLILGGGMSGLALAHYIADYNDHYKKLSKTTWVVEPRQTYKRDKTWCYWQQQTTPFDAAVTHRWYRWQISYNGQTHICECSELPYVRVDSQRYYALAQARLDKSKSVNLLTGTKATKVDVKQTKVSVSCDDLQYEADLVYDTRPKDVAPNTLLQHFVGWEITTDRDTFDPETVTLMDFQSTKGGDIHFFYVLPFDKRRALIETTHFSKTLLPDKVYEEELRTYLTEQLGICEWQIQHEERGIIPMPKNTASHTQRSHQNLIPFGLHGGTAKPSTGYCYPHAHSQAQQHASQLFAPQAQTASAARGLLARWLDTVFISFLEHQSEQAAGTFLQLFRRVPAPALVRFLSDNAKPTDYIQVILAMPKLSFIREAFRCVRNT